MKTISHLIALAVLLMAGPASAKLNVVATLPDLGSIAEHVGGDKVQVTSLAKGTEDPHFLDAKPSYIRVLNQADVLIEGGAELETGWLPPLVQGARNRKILPNGSGRLDASRGVRMLEVPTGPVDRSQGDVHAAGNPHYLLDPANGKVVAASIAALFAKLDPANAEFFQASLRAFNERVDRKLAEWSHALAPHRGVKVLTYHKDWEYFAARFGLVIAGQIEPKPGIEPSAAHVAALIPRMKEAGVKLILIETFRPTKTPQRIAADIGAKVLALPPAPDGSDKAKDYFALFDHNVGQIAAALK